MHRLAPLLALVAMSSTACTMSSGGRRATIAGGVITTVVGGFVYAQGPVDSNQDGVNENPLNDNLGAYLLGSVLVVGGLALLAGGIAAREEAEPPTVTRAPVIATAPVSPAAAPGYFQPRATLPELPTSPDVLQMAQQIRALSSDGQCAAAWNMWHRLESVDHDYAVALHGGGSMAMCPTAPSPLSMR